jgi:hypothetical protein
MKPLTSAAVVVVSLLSIANAHAQSPRPAPPAPNAARSEAIPVQKLSPQAMARELAVIAFTATRAAAAADDGRSLAASRRTVPAAVYSIEKKLAAGFWEDRRDAVYSIRTMSHTTIVSKEGIAFYSTGRQSRTDKPRAGKGLAFVRFKHASDSALRGVDPVEGVVFSDLHGNDPRKWRSNIRAYRKVLWPKAFRGIDIVFRPTPAGLEYDLVVAPEGKPELPEVEVTAEGGVHLAADGSIVAGNENGELRMGAPIVYQTTGKERHRIDARYGRIGGNHGTATFALVIGPFNHRLPLVVDPTIIYSSFLGGTAGDDAYCIAVDSGGNTYVGGTTGSVDFPQSPWSIKIRPSTGPPYPLPDCFVAKISPSGVLVYATVFGGSDVDYAYGIAVDATGCAYVAGRSFSSDYPLTPGAYWTTYSSSFLSKLNQNGSAFVYSTYVPTAVVGGLALDSGNNAYVTGNGGGTFPCTTSFGVGSAAFVLKLNPTGTAAVYASCLKGNGDSTGQWIAVDSRGDAIITGATYATNLPVTSNALQKTYAGNPYDGFVAKLSPNGTSLLYSTYLGGSSDDEPRGVAVDGSDNFYVTGFTSSSDFPTTTGAYKTTFNGGCDPNSFPADAFVTKFLSDGTVGYSTYLGGSCDDFGENIAVSRSGRAFVVGWTNSQNFPLTNDATQPAYGGGPGDAFLSILNPSGSGLELSTYLGGSSLDHASAVTLDTCGNAYVTGTTFSTNFPLVSPTQTTNAGSGYAFVTIYQTFCDNGIPAIPSSLVATANGITSVVLTWTGSPLAMSYQVARSSNAQPFATIATASSAGYTDMQVSGQITYRYKVLATGVSGASAYSNVDLATTIVFTDDPLAPTSTVAKAIHLTEVRLAVNAVRAAAGLAARSWTDASITPTVTPIAAIHIQELRTALNEGLSTLGMPTPSYANSIVAAGTTVRAVDLQEIRTAVK